MKKLIPTLFLLLPLIQYAQKTDVNYSPAQYKTAICNSSFARVQLEGTVTLKSVQQYVRSNIANLKDYRTDLRLNYVKESPGGVHYSFVQTFQAVEIYQSEIKVNVSHQGLVYAVFDNSENTSNWNLNTSNAVANSVIAYRTGTQIPVLCIRKIEDKGREILQANGELIFERDMNSYFNQDSIVHGAVFNPDPLTTAQQIYGTPYIDNDDSTNAALNLQLQAVSFTATYTGSQFILQNAFVRVSDFDLPTIAPATSNNGQFNFNRSQSGFEDVNAFYHISTVQQHIHSLGFTCADSMVDIDPHAVSGADNSYYSPVQVPNRIYYGTGGVDDAEDADVCVHEYGHFVSNGASPGTNMGSQRNSLDEGFGDYLAASYSKNLSTYHDNWVFNWDGHNEFWDGRVLDATWVYPTDLTSGIYHNAQIWSAVLWCLEGAIGRVATDSLILQTHYAYGQNISFADAASLLMYSDTLLTGGKYGCPIYNCLFQHGLNPLNPLIQCAVGIKEESDLSLKFLGQPNTFTLANANAEKLVIQILNTQGQIVTMVDENQSTFSYNNSNLPSGIYLINVSAKGFTKTFKWVKL